MWIFVKCFLVIESVRMRQANISQNFILRNLKGTWIGFKNFIK